MSVSACGIGTELQAQGTHLVICVIHVRRSPMKSATLCLQLQVTSVDGLLSAVAEGHGTAYRISLETGLLDEHILKVK